MRLLKGFGLMVYKITKTPLILIIIYTNLCPFMSFYSYKPHLKLLYQTCFIYISISPSSSHKLQLQSKLQLKLSSLQLISPNIPEEKQLQAFLETFPTHLHHMRPESIFKLWVFWSEEEEEEGSQTSSSSSSDDAASNRMIYDKIKSAFSSLEYLSDWFILQFWVPVTIGGGRLLSTSGQPFAVNHLDKSLSNYRLRSLEYQYNIDETNNNHNLDIEPDTIISGAASSAFLNRLPERATLKEQGSLLDRYALECQLEISYVLPIFYLSQNSSSCVGVIECSATLLDINNLQAKLRRVGLSVFDVQEHIPYKSINGLKHERDIIEEALKIGCESHYIGLAQVWISYEDENHVAFSSSLEDTRNKRMLALKLTGYCVHYEDSIAFRDTFEDYYDVCNILPLHTGKELVEKTFQDYKPRFCKNMSKLSEDRLMSYALLIYDSTESSALVICLRSIRTGRFDYVFEFIWVHNSSYVILLEAVLLTLKRCLPSFKFASGAELGDELHVIDVDDSTASEPQYLKIFRGQKVLTTPDTLEKEKKQMVVDYGEHSERKSKTDEIKLSRQVIEEQFGKTQKEAAKNLNVSLSTLKRKCHGYGISEWPGPSQTKRKVNDLSENQRGKNEEENGAIQDPSSVNKNEQTLIIKAEWEDDMIKFYLNILEATFTTVEKEIGTRFNLTIGTYKLKYLDEDGDWILLKTDQDMSDCIKSSRKMDRTLVRLCVQHSSQPIPRPTGSY